MMFFVKKLLLLVHSYFCNTFLKNVFQNILKLYLVGMLVDLNNLDVLEVFILSIRIKCHLRIFLQNMRVVPPSREVMCSCQSKKVLIIFSWSLYLISVGPFKFFKRVALCALLEQVKLCNYFLHFQNILLKLFCSI